MNHQLLSSTLPIHRATLKQAMYTSVKLGWHIDIVTDVANLEYGNKALDNLCKSNQASDHQTSAIWQVQESARLEFSAMTTMSQV